MKLPLQITPIGHNLIARKVRRGIRKITTVALSIWLVSAAVFLAHALNVFPPLPFWTKSTLEPEILETVVLVTRDSNEGSGILIDDSTVLTAYAALGVVAMGDPVQIVFSYPPEEPPRTVEATVSWLPNEVSPTSLCLLKLGEIQGLPPAPISEVELAEGTRLICVGYDFERQLVQIPGKVTQLGEGFGIEPGGNSEEDFFDWRGYSVFSAEDGGLVGSTTGGTDGIDAREVLNQPR